MERLLKYAKWTALIPATAIVYRTMVLLVHFGDFVLLLWDTMTPEAIKTYDDQMGKINHLWLLEYPEDE